MSARIAAAALILAALIHLLPLPGLLGGAVLRELYGLPGLDPGSELLLRHRAVLFALLAGALLAGLRWPQWQTPAIVLTLLSDMAFALLAISAPELNAALRRVLIFDLVSIAALLLAWTLLARRSG